MSGRVVGRIAMALLALVAVGSYVVQVRSVRLRENAEAAIRRAGPGAGASATAGARGICAVPRA